MASFDPFLPERRDVLPSMGDQLGRRLGQRRNPGHEATPERLGVQVAKISPKWSWLGVPSANGRKRRNNPSFLSPKRTLSVKPSAPARTASNDKSRV